MRRFRNTLTPKATKNVSCRSFVSQNCVNVLARIEQRDLLIFMQCDHILCNVKLYVLLTVWLSVYSILRETIWPVFLFHICAIHRYLWRYCSLLSTGTVLSQCLTITFVKTTLKVRPKKIFLYVAERLIQIHKSVPVLTTISSRFSVLKISTLFEETKRSSRRKKL